MSSYSLAAFSALSGSFLSIILETSPAMQADKRSTLRNVFLKFFVHSRLVIESFQVAGGDYFQKILVAGFVLASNIRWYLLLSMFGRFCAIDSRAM